MHRRSVLKSLATALGGTSLLAGGVDVAGARSNKAGAASKLQSVPFVETTDGVSLFFRDWGTGKPVVFTAPWALHSGWWEYQMAYLSVRGLRCIGCDWRGHGRSSEARSGYDFDTLACDLNAVIEQLDLHHVTLIAQSMGAGEVVRYLSRHGTARIDRIVLVAPITPFLLKTADNPDGFDKSYLEAVRQALCTDRPHVIAGAAAAFFGAPKNPVSTEMMQWWIEMLLQCSLKVTLDLHRVFTETDFRAELRTISVPTLIIHGDNDTSTPIDMTSRRTASLIRGSQLKVYEGAAHGLPITHMGRLNRDLVTFISS